MATVRLLEYAEADGVWNMAADEALLDLVAAGATPLTLRFYGWMRPCVSLGCAQPFADLDLAACRSAGLPIVRRASGGTAVLHESALGFSLAIPRGCPLAIPDIVESYRVLGEPVHRALLGLGIDGRLVPPEEAHRGSRPIGLGAAACFASLAPYEITLRGRKIVGTSQVRRRGATLHHVMIPLAFDAARLAGLLAVGSDDERRELTAYLDARIESLSMAPARRPAESRESGLWTEVQQQEARPEGPQREGLQPASYDPGLQSRELDRSSQVAGTLADALVETFAAGLDLSPSLGSLTDEERTATERLIATKYANDEWTYRR